MPVTDSIFESSEQRVLLKIGLDNWSATIPQLSYAKKACISAQDKYDLLIESQETLESENNFRFDINNYSSVNKEYL